MSPIYLTATRLREFGADRLAAHLLCMLRELPDFRGRPSVLAQNLASIEADSDLRKRVGDSADVAALNRALPPALVAATDAFVNGNGDELELLERWREEAMTRIGEVPYRLGSPTVQVPFAASAAVEVIALVDGARRQFATGAPEPELIARPMAPSDALTFGEGDAEIVIVGDPEDAGLPDMLDKAAALLRSQSRRVRWTWMHGLRTETPQAVLQAFYRNQQLTALRGAPIEVIAAGLRHPVPAQPHPPRYPDDPRTKQVLRQLSILDACGVPRSRRPALIVGRTPHLGVLGADFVAAVEAQQSGD